MKSRETILFILLIGLVNANEVTGGFISNEVGYALKLVTPVISSAEFNETYGLAFALSASSLVMEGIESDYRIEGNVYTAGVGGSYIESGYDLYLTPEQAFYSYRTEITAYDSVSTNILEIALSAGWNLISIPLM